jgi:hypothetical protein
MNGAAPRIGRSKNNYDERASAEAYNQTLQWTGPASSVLVQ